jgi:hypothetical protein
MKYIDVIIRKKKKPEERKRILKAKKSMENFEKLLESIVNSRKQFSS